MRIILSFILFILCIILLFCLLALLLEPLWYKTIVGQRPDIKLSYKDFMKYYNLAPDKYRLDSSWKHLVLYTSSVYGCIWIGFNIIDTYKVIYTLKMINKQYKIREKTNRENREMKKYLESVQKDIDNLLNKSKQQINETKKEE